MRPTALSAVLVALAGTALLAQEPKPTFEVASIRPNISRQGGGGGLQPGGRYSAINQTAIGLIFSAFGIPPERISGGPDWIWQDRYDVVAQAAVLELTSAQLQEALRHLLGERFQLVARVERRETAAYALVMARSDRRLGPKLKPATVDCSDESAVQRARASATHPVVCGGQAGRGFLVFGGRSMGALASALTNPSGRPVVNRTGLDGSYDIQLEWAPSLDVADGVSIFTALQEELGLKLEPTTVPLDHLIIEHIARPSDN